VYLLQYLLFLCLSCLFCLCYYAWTLLSADVKTGCFPPEGLRQLLGIRWYDPIRNNEVLQRPVWLHCPISSPVDASRYLGMWLDLTTTHRQTWLFSSTSTYHSTDLLTARGVAHLIVHGTSGSTSYETIPPVRMESSGDDIFERFTNAVRKYLLRNSIATSHTAVKRISLWGNLKDSYSQRMRTLVHTGRENSDAILTKVSLPVGVWTHLWHVVPWFSRLTEPNTQTRVMALFPGLPGWARARKVKPIWVLLKQETEWHCGSGFSWAICKSAPRSRQITTPAPHHSVFLDRMHFLPPNQQCQSRAHNTLYKYTDHRMCNIGSNKP